MALVSMQQVKVDLDQHRRRSIDRWAWVVLDHSL